MIVAAIMGDPNASIPTPQPEYHRPMFGAFGRSPAQKFGDIRQPGLARNDDTARSGETPLAGVGRADNRQAFHGSQ